MMKWVRKNKIAGYPYASVIVHHVTATGQNVTGRRTNFIVITKNTGRQISDNVIIQDCNGGILTYNDVAYNGNVLRADTEYIHIIQFRGSWNRMIMEPTETELYPLSKDILNLISAFFYSYTN